MKTQSFSKSIITLALTFACGLVANAASPRNYLYDTKEENGLITSKTIFCKLIMECWINKSNMNLSIMKPVKWL